MGRWPDVELVRLRINSALPKRVRQGSRKGDGEIYRRKDETPCHNCEKIEASIIAMYGRIIVVGDRCRRSHYVARQAHANQWEKAEAK